MIHALTVSLFLAGERRSEQRLAQDIRPEGTRVAVDPGVEFDVLTITIRADDVTGVYEGQRGPALAEVEVIAQATGASGSTVSFTRGDSDCDLGVNITDVIVILNSLFLGAGPLCCSQAADANDDGAVNITDPILLLKYLFQGAEPIPAPFPTCGPAPALETLFCDQEICP